MVLEWIFAVIALGLLTIIVIWRYVMSVMYRIPTVVMAKLCFDFII